MNKRIIAFRRIYLTFGGLMLFSLTLGALSAFALPSTLNCRGADSSQQYTVQISGLAAKIETAKTVVETTFTKSYAKDTQATTFVAPNYFTFKFNANNQLVEGYIRSEFVSCESR